MATFLELHLQVINDIWTTYFLFLESVWRISLSLRLTISTSDVFCAATILDFVLVAHHTFSGLRPCDLPGLNSQLIPQRFQGYPNRVWIEGAVGELESGTLGTDTAPPSSLDRRRNVCGPPCCSARLQRLSLEPVWRTSEARLDGVAESVALQ